MSGCLKPGAEILILYLFIRIQVNNAYKMVPKLV